MKKVYHNCAKRFIFLRRFDRKNTVFGISRNLNRMFRPLQGVDSSISIGRIERRYESLQTYDTNILYI